MVLTGGFSSRPPADFRIPGGENVKIIRHVPYCSGLSLFKRYSLRRQRCLHIRILIFNPGSSGMHLRIIGALVF